MRRLMPLSCLHKSMILDILNKAKLGHNLKRVLEFSNLFILSSVLSSISSWLLFPLSAAWTIHCGVLQNGQRTFLSKQTKKPNLCPKTD